MTYDLAIIGSGGAGFAAAIAASTRGLSVVMVERSTTGGTCVNVGCIPSKALLAAAGARQVAGEARFPGLDAQVAAVDMAALVSGKDEIVGALRKEKYEDLAADYGWRTVHGDARFVAGPALEVAGERIEAAHYLVATGAAPWVPALPGLQEAGYLTSTSPWRWNACPPRWWWSAATTWAWSSGSCLPVSGPGSPSSKRSTVSPRARNPSCRK